jgi:hypothetical protein
MLSSDFDSLTPLQRLVVEQAIVLAKELESTAEAAPHGQIIDHCERLLLGKGRNFLRQTLESTIRARVELLEKKGARREPARAERQDKTRENRPEK